MPVLFGTFNGLGCEACIQKSRTSAFIARMEPAVTWWGGGQAAAPHPCPDEHSAPSVWGTNQESPNLQYWLSRDENGKYKF